MSNSIPTAELCDRYAALYSGAITDVLDEHGYRDQTLDPAISPLRDGMTSTGIAYPCVGRPNRSVDEESNIRNLLKLLGEAPEHAVLAYETNATASAQIGELSVESLQTMRCRGAVLDGGVRDIGFILRTEFPVFARYRTPADAVPRWELLEWGTRAVVGGVEISPGDVVVGDIDGVVAVPEDIAIEVLQDAEALAETEDHIREAVRRGVAPLEAYEEYGVF